MKGKWERRSVSYFCTNHIIIILQAYLPLGTDGVNGPPVDTHTSRPDPIEIREFLLNDEDFEDTTDACSLAVGDVRSNKRQEEKDMKDVRRPPPLGFSRATGASMGFEAVGCTSTEVGRERRDAMSERIPLDVVDDEAGLVRSFWFAFREDFGPRFVTAPNPDAKKSE
jgi:hypothetical protein